VTEDPAGFQYRMEIISECAANTYEDSHYDNFVFLFLFVHYPIPMSYDYQGIN